MDNIGILQVVTPERGSEGKCQPKGAWAVRFIARLAGSLPTRTVLARYGQPPLLAFMPCISLFGISQILAAKDLFNQIVLEFSAEERLVVTPDLFLHVNILESIHSTKNVTE